MKTIPDQIHFTWRPAVSSLHEGPLLGSITFERTSLVVQAVGKDPIRWQEVHSPLEILRNQNGMVDSPSGRITVVHFILEMCTVPQSFPGDIGQPMVAICRGNCAG